MNVLRKMALKAGRPHLRKGWEIQMEMLSGSEYVVIVGLYDPETGHEEGMRITAVTDRSVWADGIKVTVCPF